MSILIFILALSIPSPDAGFMGSTDGAILGAPDHAVLPVPRSGKPVIRNDPT